MKYLNAVIFCFIAVIFSATPVCAEEGHDEHAEAGHAEGEHADADALQKGPHGGRLLRKDNFAIEITIFETGVPPEFRLYVYNDDQPIKPAEVTALSVRLNRLGTEANDLSFTPEKDYLLGNAEVYEPHSFEVTVKATYQGKNYQWEYDSFESRTEINPRSAKLAGIEIATAAPATIRETRSLQGRITPDSGHVYRVIGRYMGTALDVNAQIGDSVKRGDVLATLENSDTLQRYVLKAPADGVVLERHINIGEAVDREALFVIADLNYLWLDAAAFVADIGQIKLGQRVLVRAANDQIIAESTLNYIAPQLDIHSQSFAIRANLDNRQQQLPVGLPIRAEIITAIRNAPLAVKAEALQTFNDDTVVFVRVGDIYEVRPVETGARDGDWVEIRAGLRAGDNYVTANSYLVKADILKSGASHDH
jgi:cobalt-zinc-cadmium efflux system membrane fusion protein